MSDLNQKYSAADADTLIQRLVTGGSVNADELQPCSAEDIRALEMALDVRLPEAYRVFLRKLGRGAGTFLQRDGAAAFYAAVLELTDVFREGFGDRVDVPAGWFCFATQHRGDLFLFLPADGSDDDPPVYFWSEEWSEGGTLDAGYPSFWDWFAECVEEEVRANGDPAPVGG